MEPQTTLHERRQLNYEIELTFIAAAETATMIHVSKHTGMGGSVLDLYQRFYSAFDYLFILTSDLKQLSQEQHKKRVESAEKWLQADIKSSDDNILLARCEEGYVEFMKYKKLLTEQGIIALPLK
jgi:hypothetical protein